MIKNLAHLCIFSTDLARTREFYCGVLGLTTKFEFWRKGQLYGFYLAIGPSQFVEFFLRTEISNEPSPHIGHLCLEVDDIQQIRATLTAAGLEATEPKLGADQSWQTWSKDPDGTPIEFHQYTPESSQHTGRHCEVNW